VNPPAPWAAAAFQGDALHFLHQRQFMHRRTSTSGKQGHWLLGVSRVLKAVALSATSSCLAGRVDSGHAILTSTAAASAGGPPRAALRGFALMWVEGPLDRGFDQSEDSRQSDRRGCKFAGVFQALSTRAVVEGRKQYDEGGAMRRSPLLHWATSGSEASARFHRQIAVTAACQLSHQLQGAPLSSGNAQANGVETQARKRGQLGWDQMADLQLRTGPGGTKAPLVHQEKRGAGARAAGAGGLPP